MWPLGVPFEPPLLPLPIVGHGVKHDVRGTLSWGQWGVELTITSVSRQGGLACEPSGSCSLRWSHVFLIFPLKKQHPRFDCHLWSIYCPPGQSAA